MIWIRIFIILFVGLMGIYYGMLILQCLTSWFKMTNREITFVRCLIPFYYWIAPINEHNRAKSDYEDENEDDDESIAREKEINKNINKYERIKEDKN